MQYREDKVSGNNLSALGLGCMRFPRDKAEAERVVLAAIDGGINYFDTAYIYPNNEVMIGEILAKHDKRKDVYIATKLPLVMCKKYEDFDRFFYEQLDRLQTDYIDYYFMHSISRFSKWEFLLELGIEKWLAEKKATGQIRQVGFSYHGSSDDFPLVISSYPWEFCMLQYNYADENYQAGKEGLLDAHKKGLTIMIMEPLLGGRLATGLPKEATNLFAASNAELTPADHALWWLWNHHEITVVLSGMNSVEIVKKNLDSIDKFSPLSEEELSVYADVVELLRKAYKVNCTSCNYCVPCPQGINIPSCLTAYNMSYTQGLVTGLMLFLTTTGVLSNSPGSPRKCNNCGKCENICPQNIPIRKFLKKTSRRLESLPMRLLFVLLRKVMLRRTTS